MKRIALMTFVLLASVTSAAGKPAIQVQFQLVSKTLSQTISNTSTAAGHDYLKDVSNELIGELRQQAGYYFPFIDWRTDSQNVLKNLVVMIWEEPAGPARSNYKIKYWTGGHFILNSWQGGREILIGSSDAFIPYNDLQQPTNDPPELIRRAKQQIDDDIRKAAVKDFLNLFLAGVQIVSIPPATENLRLSQPCLLDLPLAWDALLADRTQSTLRAEFSSKTLPDGRMELEDPHQCETCGPVKAVRGEIRNLNIPGVPPCPASWTPEQKKAVEDAFSRDGLQKLKVFVKQYSRLLEDPQ